MSKCEVCGNEYERLFEVRMPSENGFHVFDSFECASHALAPRCQSCSVKIMGHGVEMGDRLFCSAHCARQNGVDGLIDHAFSENEMGH